ncbi:MAG: nucleotidyltransferase domain-containing protein [Ignavibacteriales bacterium]|nr:nucleotidyltransferase domain-containing protein [Ignavibacteriales bacterium]
MNGLSRIVNNINIREEQPREICKGFLIRGLALFGSVLRQDFNANSDIDLRVEFTPEFGVS